MSNVNSRIGETRLMSNGMNATIVAYRNFRDIDVQFEDGSIIQNRRYDKFEKGWIAHSPRPKSNKQKLTSEDVIGETRVMHNGLKATVITYRRSKDIDVRFEDGTVVKHKQYSHFQNGEIVRPQDKNYFVDSRIGEVNTMCNGLQCTIVAYRNTHDIDIQFEDGLIIKNQAYSNFKKCKISYPLITCYGRSRNFYGYEISKPIKISEDMVIYRAENLETKERELLTLQQILEKQKIKESKIEVKLENEELDYEPTFN